MTYGKTNSCSKTWSWRSNFRASTHKRVAPAKYPPIAPKESFEASIMGTITDLVHDPGRGAPLSLIKFENGLSIYTVAPEGVFTGQQICLAEKLQLKSATFCLWAKFLKELWFVILNFDQVMEEKWQSLQVLTQQLSVTHLKER